jgi:hypothetical protein
LRKDFPMADDASRGPGEGIRPMETPLPPGDVRREPVIRTSPGAGAVIGPDGEMLVVGAGTAAGELESGEEQP